MTEPLKRRELPKHDIISPIPEEEILMDTTQETMQEYLAQLEASLQQEQESLAELQKLASSVNKAEKEKTKRIIRKYIAISTGVTLLSTINTVAQIYLYFHYSQSQYQPTCISANFYNATSQCPLEKKSCPLSLTPLIFSSLQTAAHIAGITILSSLK